MTIKIIPTITPSPRVNRLSVEFFRFCRGLHKTADVISLLALRSLQNITVNYQACSGKRFLSNSVIEPAHENRIDNE